MAESVSSDQLIADLQAVVRDAESLLKATASHAGAKVNEARSRAEETVRKAKERMSEVEQEALAKAKELAGDADRYVRQNPWQAIGIAAGIGFLVGLLARR
jgi:ElaB/YqjD/DUF883 family membrane-anchored ribosome-binding protein